MSWTPDQVRSFAPDPATAKRGQGLASERNWRMLTGNTRAIWGECKSSSVSYYRTQVDLNGPAFKCNCPSRKFPCKHAIALLLIFVSRSEAFHIQEEMPPWVSEWIASRAGREVATADPAKEVERLQKNAESRQKNRDKRVLQMLEGVGDLETWLLDLVRQGLAATEQLEYTYWQEIAARMVDHKMGAVGLKVRSLALLQGGGTDWPEQMLSELAELYLLSQGLKQLDRLPEPLQEQVLQVAGRNVQQKTLLEQTGLSDTWIVMGQLTGVNIDNGTFRRTWLWGAKTERWALLLEYDYRDIGFPQEWPIGQSFAAEVVYFPGSFPLRVVVKKNEYSLERVALRKGAPTIDTFLADYAQAIAANPWILDYPAHLENVIPVYEQGQLYIVDEQRKSLPVVSRDQMRWKILASSGGHPIAIFGEWTGRRLVPLAMVVKGRLVGL